MFLSKNEIEELTGYKYQSKQINWLQARGYCYEVTRNGKPKILKAHVEDLLSLKSRPTRSASLAKPDFEVLR